jgi:pimeloyl-ACP methyl ester carboxylesterase
MNAFDKFRAMHPGRDFDRGGLRLHYLDEGRGEPVVMLHGNPSWSFYYRKLVEALNDSYRVIVPDQIGCGLSDKPDDSRYDYTLESRVADLEALLADLGIDTGITLVLHDWGGMIGMIYATRYPERIARLVVLNTAAFHLPRSKRLPWQLRVIRDTPIGPWLVRGLNAFARGATRYCVTKRPMTPDVRSAYLAPYDSWDHRIAVLRFVQDIPLGPGDRAYRTVDEVESRLHRLAGVPTWIGWGLKDFVFDHRFLEEWLDRFPEAEVHRFESAGHYVLEDEAEAIAPMVRAFLAAHPVLREVGRG